MKIEIIKGAADNPVAEFFSSSSTPETDAAWSCFKGYMEPLQDVKDLSRKLERERDKLKQFLASDSERVDAYLGVRIQRDEAREKLAKITRAAEAVIDRWEQPAWKDTEPTATVIYRLRDALGREAE